VSKRAPAPMSRRARVPPRVGLATDGPRVLGRGGGRISGPAERAAFAAGAFGASLSWQTFIAAVGGVGHRRPPPAFLPWTSIAGSLIVMAFAVVIVLDVAGA